MAAAVRSGWRTAGHSSKPQFDCDGSTAHAHRHAGAGRPSTPCGTDAEEGVDAGPAPGITIWQRPCVSTNLRSAVAGNRLVFRALSKGSIILDRTYFEL